MCQARKKKKTAERNGGRWYKKGWMLAVENGTKLITNAEVKTKTVWYSDNNKTEYLSGSLRANKGV